MTLLNGLVGLFAVSRILISVQDVTELEDWLGNDMPSKDVRLIALAFNLYTMGLAFKQIESENDVDWKLDVLAVLAIVHFFVVLGLLWSYQAILDYAPDCLCHTLGSQTSTSTPCPHQSHQHRNPQQQQQQQQKVLPPNHKHGMQTKRSTFQTQLGSLLHRSL